MVFVFGNRASAEPTVDKQTLIVKMGPLTLENGFIRGALTKVGLLSAGKRGTRLRSDDRSFPKPFDYRQAQAVAVCIIGPNWLAVKTWRRWGESMKSI